ncbi:hypothetical protein L915_08098 [Phytophthora nicotianae]|uniref:Uncharacterized protein n=1 Tax=Phytophthora nicotianae TaxID=4792 RepID=W2GYZ5_PHYNI|nr:hypothetical protein L915_08098 [Phytophthora nicotianae]ETM47302.1 hypothetical protein L914_07981 [Phytophthora nicotianae]
MEFSLKKLRLRDEWTLPSFRSVFPDASSSQATSEAIPVDASMTLGGLPPISALNETQQNDVNTEDVSNTDTTLSNEIMTAFDSLDAQAESDALPLEFQCRYRHGKCSKPRTLKKNGSMHSFCEYHRQLSVRNQRVFDQKKRHKQELPTSNTESNISNHEDAQQDTHEAKKRPKRRRRTV